MTDTVHGLRCWDEEGRLTFDINIQTMRSTTVLIIPSGASGSIALSDLPSGVDGISFVPVVDGSSTNIAPFTWTDDHRLYWRQSAGAYRLSILDMSGLGGSMVIEE